MSHHHIKNHFRKNTDSTHHLKSSTSARILTGSDPTLSRGKVFELLQSVYTSEKFPAWSDSLPANLPVELDTPAVETTLKDNSPPNSPAR